MAMLDWKLVHPLANMDMLGFIPEFIHGDDKRSAKEQFNDRYGFAGGWSSFKGHKMLADRNLQYQDDGQSPLQLLAEATLRQETILIYERAWVAILQQDGSFEVSRID